MAIPMFIVDAFTDRPFAGNPAAVCILEKERPDHWLRDVAREMNLSETAFLIPGEDGYLLRWFTPAVEVDLCGHATLASAHILLETGRLSSGSIARFHTRSGLLTATRRDGWIEMDFPAEPAAPFDTTFDPAEILGVPAFLAGRNRMDYLVEVPDESALREIQPDFESLSRLPCRGMIVTCRSTGGEFDFMSRFFAPGAGIPEDPVTGSAHCCLGPYWARKLGKTAMTAVQASARGGIVRVELAGERVRIGGAAVTVLKGELAAECAYGKGATPA
jgi:PhzF family phenazine biosynthesis protein